MCVLRESFAPYLPTHPPTTPLVLSSPEGLSSVGFSLNLPVHVLNPENSFSYSLSILYSRVFSSVLQSFFVELALYLLEYNHTTLSEPLSTPREEGLGREVKGRRFASTMNEQRCVPK